MDYVLIFAKKSNNDEFIVVEKEKPYFQKGRYNLPGGKIEAGENCIEAGLRELKEETGFVANYIYEAGVLVGSWGKVYCLKAEVEDGKITPREGEIERFFWSDFSKIRFDQRLLPNLKVIIPLFIAGMERWTVLDEGCSTIGLRHQFSVAV